jgi:hypothetical protein
MCTVAAIFQLGKDSIRSVADNRRQRDVEELNPLSLWFNAAVSSILYDEFDDKELSSYKA